MLRILKVDLKQSKDWSKYLILIESRQRVLNLSRLILHGLDVVLEWVQSLVHFLYFKVQYSLLYFLSQKRFPIFLTVRSPRIFSLQKNCVILFRALFLIHTCTGFIFVVVVVVRQLYPLSSSYILTGNIYLYKLSALKQLFMSNMISTISNISFKTRNVSINIYRMLSVLPPSVGYWMTG